MRRLSSILFILITLEWLAAAPPVRAQTDMAGCKVWLNQAPVAHALEEGHFKLVGAANTPVVVDCDQTQLVADEMEVFQKESRVIARGHVVYSSPENRIYADRLEFNTQTKLGTFYVAYGTAHLGERADRSMFGTQEPYAYFYGDEIHKTGAKTYKIVRGGFTTCVQPTPRWEVTSGSLTVEMDDHALLRHSLFKVKGVPLFYLPIFYYPIQEDDRATGFLMPLYGNSTYRGQTISNAFFWAISRSQDLTLMHDWFTRTGHGYGAEYRYVASPQSSGNITYYRLNEHSAEITRDGATVTTPAGQNYNLRADVRQSLPANTRLIGSIDYFSSVTTQQLYQQDIFQSTLASRTWSLASTSNWSGFNLLAAYQDFEYFYGENLSVVTSVKPRLSFSRGATRLGNAPVYVAGSTDYSNLIRQTRSGETVNDASMDRVDAMGSVRVPFPTFPFLSLTSSLTWRGTRYGRSAAPDNPNVLVDLPLLRRYYEFAADLVGPSVVRIWHRPNSGMARKVKHLIEPRFEWRRWTSIDNVDRVFRYDSSDYLLGGYSHFRYGVTTRVLVKGAEEDSMSRELLSASVQQTYYTDPRAANFDPAYSTSFLTGARSAFSAVSISASLTPATGSSVSARIEYDPILSGLQGISLGGELRRPHIEASGSFSKRKVKQVGPFLSTDLINGATTLRNERNTLGGTYSFNYDLGRSVIVQQRIAGYYNAQCCGVGVEYQVYNYPRFSRFIIPQDRRFNISFSLAGIGSFSNFLGALTGQPTRR